jgi:hypothetical protein
VLYGQEVFLGFSPQHDAVLLFVPREVDGHPDKQSCPPGKGEALGLPWCLWKDRCVHNL